MDILQELKAVVNISKATLETQRFNIKLHTENNTISELHVIGEISKNIVKLPLALRTVNFGTKLQQFQKTSSYLEDFSKPKTTRVLWK